MSAGDLDRGDQVAVECPACGHGEPVAHEVVKPANPATVRCLTCEHVHKTQVASPSTVPVRVVVSMEGESVTTTADVPATERLAVGEEFVVDTDEAILGVRITSLELGAERRAEVAEATAVETIWTRAVDNVAVNATIHPADGGREDTRSETLHLPGDEPITVGETVATDGDELTVEGIRLRDDARGYATDHFDRQGDSAPAKDVKRVYARTDADASWRSPWDDV